MSGNKSQAREVISKLRSCGHSAYLVGGCVRDLLLGRHPKDFDIATSATPAEVAGVFPNALEVGAHFGVMLVPQGGAIVEVATYRSDGAYSDGRRPDQVQFETDPRQDALRRDFTINGLFLNPESDEILDFVGGRADLNHRVIRAIGDPEARFAEDYLRMLRAVRFAARFDFAVEPHTARAIRQNADRVRAVAPERVRDELTRILTEGGARRGFELLDSLGLLEAVLPEVAAFKGVAQPPEYHPEGDVWIHTLLMLEGLHSPSASLAWGVLLHDSGKPETFTLSDRIRFHGHVDAGMRIARSVLTRLRAPNDLIDRVLALVEHHMKLHAAWRMRPSTLKRFLRMDHIDEHLELHRLDCLSSRRSLDNWKLAREALSRFSVEELRPARLLTGNDLQEMGIEPGPEIGRILAALEEAQLEGLIRSRDQAMELARSMAQE